MNITDKARQIYYSIKWLPLFRRNFIWGLRSIRVLPRFSIKRARKINVLYLFFDPRLPHPGLADRIKTIVSCYFIAKTNNYDFKIIFQRPFKLSDYLIPNIIDWEATEDDIEYSLVDTKIFNYNGKLVKFKPNKVYLCFNYADAKLQIVHNDESIWRGLFRELFLYSPKIENQLKEIASPLMPYVAVHLRFVNALGKTEKGKSELKLPHQNNLIDKCKNAIRQICEDSDGKYQVIVFSDTSYFLRKIRDLPIVLLDLENICHIGYTNDSNAILKTFVDFCVMSRAEKVYRILAPEMFKSGFSYIAAISGSADLVDVIIA